MECLECDEHKQSRQVYESEEKQKYSFIIIFFKENNIC